MKPVNQSVFPAGKEATAGKKTSSLLPWSILHLICNLTNAQLPTNQASDFHKIISLQVLPNTGK
jgi:hypothetical protein